MAKHASSRYGQAPLFGLTGGPGPCRPSRRALAIGGGALVALAFAALGLWMALGGGAGSLEGDVNARQGSLHAATVEVPEGGFQLVLNQTPTARVGSDVLNVEFENPLANAYTGTLTLYLEDGRALGTTPAVEPGWYVKDLRMNEQLPAGVYPATAEVVLENAGQQVGQSTAAVEVRVG